ncbi:hypothetical protein Bbelb_046800 [Branchiostoma belcheri]|nr:hypothetical protein Bbelb_046800 [Branchiostoma belcheri]
MSCEDVFACFTNIDLSSDRETCGVRTCENNVLRAPVDPHMSRRDTASRSLAEANFSPFLDELHLMSSAKPGKRNLVEAGRTVLYPVPGSDRRLLDTTDYYLLYQARPRYQWTRGAVPKTCHGRIYHVSLVIFLRLARCERARSRQVPVKAEKHSVSSETPVTASCAGVDDRYRPSLGRTNREVADRTTQPSESEGDTGRRRRTEPHN